MPLDVPTPPPPSLDTDASVADYDDAQVSADADTRRDELDELLDAGAWVEAFEAWAAETELDAHGYAIVGDLDLLAEFDFFWDDFAGRVGFHAPGIPEDWQERDLHPELDTWGTVSTVNASLTSLGRTVADTLEADYVDWEADYEAPDDLPEF